MFQNSQDGFQHKRKNTWIILFEDNGTLKHKLSPLFQEYVGTLWKVHDIYQSITGLLYLCLISINNRLYTTRRFFFGPVY